jgi:hypothetical protein
MGLWTLLHRRRGGDHAGRAAHPATASGPSTPGRETFAPRHIVRFTHDSNMQSGSVFYYRVRAETTFGKTKTLHRRHHGIRHRRRLWRSGWSIVDEEATLIR